MDDDFTMQRRLCDNYGVVSDVRIPGSPNLFDPELTYLRQINNLRAHSGHPPVEAPFACTGSAHLAGEHIYCTSPAHQCLLCCGEGSVVTVDGHAISCPRTKWHA